MTRLSLAFIVLAVLPVGRAQAVTPPETDGTPTVQEMIEEAWPDDAEMALCVAEKESGFEPTAIDPTGTYAGLYQVSWRLHRQSFSAMLEAEANIAFSRRLYDDQVWAPWLGTYRLCSALMSTP